MIEARRRIAEGFSGIQASEPCNGTKAADDGRVRKGFAKLIRKLKENLSC
jgi:hypothetical protein